MAYLEPFVDPGLSVDLALSPEDLAAKEVERLQVAGAMAFAAGQIPRRLGDASPDELALDKKRARRVLHVCRQSVLSWAGTLREATPDEISDGAQIRWDIWYEEHCTVVAGRRLYFATWAKRTGQSKFGKTAVVRLSNEMSWLEYAMRE